MYEGDTGVSNARLETMSIGIFENNKEATDLATPPRDRPTASALTHGTIFL